MDAWYAHESRCIIVIAGGLIRAIIMHSHIVSITSGGHFPCIYIYLATFDDYH